METLAYIHSVQASDIDASQLDWRLDWQLFGRFPSFTTCVKILSIPLSLTLISSTTDALALLRRGDSGAEITNLQNQLKSLGYFQAQPTGFFASHTLEAVTRFQADHGLPQDGIVGQQTQRSIAARLGNSANNQAPNQAPNSIASQAASQSAQPIANSSLPATATGNLYLGVTGVAVSKLQDDLRIVGFYSGATTGVFDRATEEAVISLQKSQELTADGIAGAKTLASLENLKKNGSGVSFHNVTIQLNSRGEAVRNLQMKLAQLGYYTAGITGVFEEKTVDAVLRFQKDRGLATDGVVRTETWEELSAQ
jgi:stage II sporulation protein D